jgi:hypothetical protein
MILPAKTTPPSGSGCPACTARPRAAVGAHPQGSARVLEARGPQESPAHAHGDEAAGRWLPCNESHAFEHGEVHLLPQDVSAVVEPDEHAVSVEERGEARHEKTALGEPEEGVGLVTEVAPVVLLPQAASLEVEREHPEVLVASPEGASAPSDRDAAVGRDIDAAGLLAALHSDGSNPVWNRRRFGNVFIRLHARIVVSGKIHGRLRENIGIGQGRVDRIEVPVLYMRFR